MPTFSVSGIMAAILIPLAASGVATFLWRLSRRIGLPDWLQMWLFGFAALLLFLILKP